VRPGIRATAVVIALIAAAIEVPGLVSTMRIRQSQNAARLGDPGLARASAEEAIDAEPWAASPHAQLALVDQSEGRFREAEQNIRVAISKESTNWRWPLILASIQANNGERDAARSTILRSKQLYPISQYYSLFSDYASGVFSPRQLQRLRSRANHVAGSS